MKKKRLAVIHFDYEGHYSSKGEDVKWVSKQEKMYSIIMNTSIGEESYSGLVEKIKTKMKLDEGTANLRISYIPLLVMERKKPIEIRDDEDVMCFLLEVNKEGCRSILNVEVDVNVEENLERIENNFRVNSRVDQIREVVGSNEVILPICGVNVDDNLYVGESSQQIEMMDNDENNLNVDNCGTFDNIGVERREDYASFAWEDGLNFTVGQEFGSKRAMQCLIEKAGHKNCFEFDVIKSDTTRYVVKCSEWEKGCEWFVRAARKSTSEFFSIRTYKNIHTCSRTNTSTGRSRRRGTTKLVASICAEDYPGTLKTPAPKVLIDLVQGRYGVPVSYSTAWRGKREGANLVRGTPEESFRYLFSYMFMLEKMNPGTVTYVEVDKEHKFKYLFFALGVSIEGFRVMRKVIIVDGTHIKNVYGGVLIVATAQDPDHHHYPIAFGVVDGEKDASCTWFFNKLKSVIPDCSEMVFISDRNQSLIKSIGEVYPLSQHGYCIYHLSQNVKGSVHGVKKETVEKKFMECARAYTEAEFLQLYGDFTCRFPKGREYLDKNVDVKKWARCYFAGEKYNLDTTNCAESINGVLVQARELSLLPMVDTIIEKMAEWFNKFRRISAEIPSGQKLVPFVENELHTRCMEAKLFSVHELNTYELEYSVMGNDGIKYLVNLITKSCSCLHFDIDRFPCAHAIAAAREAKKNAAPEIQLHDLCSKYYMMEFWVLAYSRTIYLVPHMSQWIVPDEIKTLFSLPPDYVVKRGRKKITRIPSIGEHRGRKKKSGLGQPYEWFNNDSGEGGSSNQV